MANLCTHCQAPVEPGQTTCGSCGRPLPAGEGAAAATRDRYTEEQWQSLVFAPMWIYDSMGYPDVDLDDTEWEEFFERLLDRKDAATDELTRSVLAALDESWEDIDADYRNDETEPLSGLRRLGELLDRSEAPDVVASYTFTMVDVAFDLAKVSGFEVTSSSLGGEERQRVAALAEALKLDAEELVAWLSEDEEQGEAAGDEVEEIYAEEEWELLRFTPFWIYSMVAGADGMRDQQEWRSFKQTIRSLEDSAENELTSDLMYDLMENMDAVVEAFLADETEPEEGLRRISALIAEREDSDTVYEFKHDMVSLAFRVAKASGGSAVKGFLAGLSVSFGLSDGADRERGGGSATIKHSAISVEEEEELKKIATALGLDPVVFLRRLGVEARS